MLFKSILVALGGGGASRAALREAVDMARAARGKITAIFVVDHHLAVGDVLLEISEERIFRSFVHEEPSGNYDMQGTCFLATELMATP